MVESNHLVHIKEINTNLILGNKRKEFSITLNNAFQPTTSRDMQVEKREHIKSNILHPIDLQQQSEGQETKANHITIRECSTSYREDTVNRIIDKLKSKPDQQKSTDISINYTNNKPNVFQNNVYKRPSKRHIEGAHHLNPDATKGKLNENGLQKDSKRLKVNRIFESKQTNLTEFYSVVKSVNVNSSGQNSTSECINKQFSSNYATINELKNPNKERSSSEFSTSKRDTIKNKKLGNHNLPVRNSSDVKIESEKTFEEVCDDILVKLSRKRKISAISPDSNYNTFSKSFSTGDITEKEYHENVNSVPITECETENANRQLENNKTEFDKFLDKIICKIKHVDDNTNNTKPYVCNTGIDKVNEYSGQFKQNYYLQSIQMPQVQYINGSICHNTEICSTNTQYLDKEQNINSLENALEKSIFSKNNLQNGNKPLKVNKMEQTAVTELKKPFPNCTFIKEFQNPFQESGNTKLASKRTNLLNEDLEINNFVVPNMGDPDQESGNTKLLTSKRTNLLSEDLEIYNFVVPNRDDKIERKKTSNELCDEIHMKLSKKTKLPKITPDSHYKTHLRLKSFSTGDKIEKENHENVNSVPITEYETKNAERQLENSKTEFDNFLEKLLRNIEQNENIKNKTTPDIHKTDNNKASGKSLEKMEYEYNNFNDTNDKCYTEPSQKYEYSSQFTQNDYSQSMQNHGINEDICQNNEEICIMNSLCLVNEQDSSHHRSITNLENSIEMQIDSLENELEKSILSETLKTYNTSTEQSTKQDLEPDKPVKLDNFIENMINIEKKDSNNHQQPKSKFRIKRYKKGKTKIYRLKKSRIKDLQTEINDEDLNFHDILEKVTNGHCESQTRLLRYKSGSSISTPSSYITDETRSEILSTGSKELTSPQRRLRNGFNELSKDKSLCYSAKEWEDVTEHEKECLKMKLQDIFFQILQDFKDKKPSYFKHRRQSFNNCIFKDGRLQLKPPSESSVTIISSGVQNSKPKFQLMLYIMKKIQTLLEDNTKLTKREVYYQLKEFISDQRASDRAINAISCLLDVGMWAFNITAQKGLVFGDLKLLLSSGEMLNCNIPGTLIPQDISAVVEIHSPAYFILVVEKESIFHKLIQEDLPNKLTRPFILITGKGFPDLNTQLFLKKLWTVMSVPVFILVDADPHGINIMLNYRFGSLNHAHVSQHLAVPQAKWLGVYPSEIINLNIARQPLTEKDVKLIKSILTTPYMEFSTRLVEELNILLANRYKAGIEGLMKTNSYLSQTYLPNKFFSHNFI